MNEIAFFDTNILLYVCEQRELAKGEIARRLYMEYLENGTLRISTQVVQEFYTAATRKLGMPAADAAAKAEALCGLELLVVGPPDLSRLFTGAAIPDQFLGCAHRILCAKRQCRHSVYVGLDARAADWKGSGD